MAILENIFLLVRLHKGEQNWKNSSVGFYQLYVFPRNYGYCSTKSIHDWEYTHI
jgi:hypothetical protein